MEQKYDIFISYRRDGGESTAKMLRDKLDSLGYRVFFDVESLRSGNFNIALYTVIDECKDFILVLSPNALDRCSAKDDWVRLEIERALQQGCNVIPIMLRMFSFPKELPESIDEIRYKNGLESNYQFFDAFIEKLQSFLLSSPSHKKWTSFKRFSFIFATFLVMFLACMGGAHFLNSEKGGNSSYPCTSDERNITGSFINYVEINLQQAEQAAEYIDKSYQACSQYLAHIDTASRTALVAELNKNKEGLAEIDLESSSMPYELQYSLSNSPFSIDDANAMHDDLKTLIKNGINDIEVIQIITHEEYMADIKTTEKIIKNYDEMLSEKMKSLSYVTNQLLLPIQNEETLEEFKCNFLSELYYIPLQTLNWSDDEKMLESDNKKSQNTIQKIDDRIALLVGDENLQVMQMKEQLIQQLAVKGYAEGEVEQAVENQLGKIQLVANGVMSLDAMQSDVIRELDAKKVRAAFMPSEEDDGRILWNRMGILINYLLYDEAIECVDIYQEKMRDEDIYVETYCAAAIRFIKNIEYTGINYGAMVVGYKSEKDHNTPYEIGDVIIAVNQKPCHDSIEYSLLKDIFSENEDTEVIVLRVEDKSGKLEQVKLVLPAKASEVSCLSMTSPPIILS